MNKLLSIALSACLLTAVAAQPSTATTTTAPTSQPTAASNGQVGSWCRSNTDCNGSPNLCCSASGTTFGYLQFNCQSHTNFVPTTGKCIPSTTDDYKELCKGQGKICLNSQSKATFCGGSFTMIAVDAWPNVDCVSSAFNLFLSIGFLAMIALSFVF